MTPFGAVPSESPACLKRLQDPVYAALHVHAFLFLKLSSLPPSWQLILENAPGSPWAPL